MLKKIFKFSHFFLKKNKKQILWLLFNKTFNYFKNFSDYLRIKENLQILIDKYNFNRASKR